MKPILKTVIIYDQCEANITFFVLDGDFTRFKGVYVNLCVNGTRKEQKAADKLQDELSDLIYDPETGETILPAVTEFPTQAVLDGAAVIVAGFLP